MHRKVSRTCTHGIYSRWSIIPKFRCKHVRTMPCIKQILDAPTGFALGKGCVFAGQRMCLCWAKDVFHKIVPAKCVCNVLHGIMHKNVPRTCKFWYLRGAQCHSQGRLPKMFARCCVHNQNVFCMRTDVSEGRPFKTCA